MRIHTPHEIVRTVAAAVVALCVGASATVARADTCTPARTSQDLATLEPAWGDAMSSLVAATSARDQPWGCPKATLRLDVLDEGAQLVVLRDDGPELSRHVMGPEDVVMTGKALLARAQPQVVRPPVIVDAPAPAANKAETAPDVVEPDEEAARAYLRASGALRFAGASDVIAVGAGGRGIVPIGRWSINLGARYVLGVADVGSRTADQEFEFAELSINGGVGYALIEHPVRLQVGLYGALAVVDMELGTEDEEGEDSEAGDTGNEVSSGAVDGRVGLELALSVPIWGPLNFASSIDAEMAPASLADLDRRIDPALPPLPAYTIGTSFGLEVAIP